MDILKQLQQLKEAAPMVASKFEAITESKKEAPEENSSKNKPKLSQYQTALIYCYHRDPILKPSSTETTAQEAAEKYGNKSGANLYNIYSKISGKQNQRLNYHKSKIKTKD